MKRSIDRGRKLELQSNVKDWQNVSKHLKELEDEDIPSSQTIDDISSEEEETLIHLKLKKFLPRRKCQKSIASTNKAPNSPIFKSKLKVNSSQEVLSNNSSLSPGNKSFKRKNVDSKGKDSTNIIYEQTSPVLKPRCLKSANSPHSPILKSKIKRTNLRLVTSFNDKTFHTNTVFHNEQKVINKKSSESLKYFCGKSIPIHKSKDNKCFNNDSLKESFEPNLYKYRLLYDCNQIDITNCLSPSKSQEECITSSTLSISSAKTILSETNVDIATDDRRGSEWVKCVQSETPEKCGNPPAAQPYEFDSTKKKVKKNGFADQLKKLTQSWQSSISIWNHQVSLALRSQDFSCLSSQLVINGKTLNVKQNSNEENKNSQSSYSPNSYVRKCSTPNHSSTFFQLGEDSYFAVTRGKPFKSPLQTCIRSLRSTFESSNESSVENTPRRDFTFDKKHKCLKILKVECQTSVMVSTLCMELGRCYLKGSDDVLSGNCPKVYVVLFEISQTNLKKQIEILEHGNLVTIFAPWQSLKLRTLPHPVLFSSYFTSRSSSVSSDQTLIRADYNLKEVEIKLASWECSCLSDFNSLTQECFEGGFKVCKSDESMTRLLLNQTTERQQSSRVFNTIRESPINSSPKCERFWTIIEAIEQCGGMPDISVSLTIRIKRIFSMRSALDSNIDHYLIVGQDPNGTFALVQVPNRPLKSTLRSLLEDGLDTTRTLTHLSVTQRIVDTDDPELFSLIGSLQTTYMESLSKNQQLLSLLKDHLKRPLQSFCYKFIVNLGQTLEFKISETNILSSDLPHWSLEELIELKEDGKRGKVSVLILYRLHPYLYVACRKPKGSIRFSEISANFSYGIYKILLRNSLWLPSWMSSDGTIMTAVEIQDIIFWKGVLVVDKFSHFERRKEEARVSGSDLISVIPSLSFSSEAFDLVTVTGKIRRVMEENCLVWEECNICGGTNLYRITRRNLKCQSCCTENISPLKKYSLVVELDERHLFQDLDMKLKLIVKLFQSTTKNLLKTISMENNQYKAEELTGATIGPLICCLKSVEVKRRRREIFAIELPY